MRFATQCSKTSASSDVTSDTVECGLADAPWFAVLSRLVESGEVGEDERFEINEGLRDLKQDSITAKPKVPAPKIVVLRKKFA
jgi:hypothetical protein